ncbi:type II secretion system secretin GspD [Desulforhopalus sp. IMCC35007]|uniref:type II secretion system secretin GspD n=1 Tax=Desulforhopalus sp. IMCC35007 TaxID=2569543 RepID=UPI0010AE6F7E|nr:type II secretion system secretin GspD [Desulforhopalus sp. IMCC35007]TKB07295.1 type II secretion system protein GspD [Desulforhopalus sp. IMCC35007]
MNRWKQFFLSIVLISLCLGLYESCLFAEDLPKPLPGTLDENQNNEQHIIIDFDSVDIHLFIKFISELTGKNFVVDKTVQGNVTIISPTRISVDEAYRVFESVLEVHGFTTVESGAVTKILPSARARSQNIEMLSSGLSDRPEDKVVTQLIPLKYSSPDDLKKVLAPLVSQTSVLIAHTPSGMLIITETMSNIQKLLGIIKVLDVQSREDEVAVISLNNASAEALGKILTTIYQKTQVQAKAGEGVSSGQIKVVPYERVNALIIVANSGEMGRVKSLINMLDTKVQRADGNIHVYYLQNATAAEMVKVLNVLPTNLQQGEQPTGKQAAISKDVTVMADDETNALIITATKDEYAVLEDVIKKLDIPRRMVYLEALIMEVDVDHTLDFGVEWAAGGEFSDSTGTLATGFSSENGFSFIEGISSQDPSLPSGFSFGVLKQGIELGGVTFPNIGAMITAVRTDSNVNVISTPQILTMDNKKAEISVGDTVPYITSQNTTASEQDYTQYEYKDVATKLSITPHINQASTLRLEIETEVVRLKDNSATPTTFERRATTTVIVRDQQTIVIGGIIGHDVTESEWKIPLLGDIPYLGWLFKTHSTNDTKTNMFIFITPRIIRNPAEIASISLEKKDQLDAVHPSVKEELQRDGNPAHAEQLTIKGFERLMEGDLAEAKQYFEQALQISPDNPYALMNLGVIYEQENLPQQALDMYRAVLATGSDIIAEKTSDPAATGRPILELAREHIERIEKDGNSPGSN